MRLLIGYDGSECARAAIADLKRAGLPDDCQALVLSAVDSRIPRVSEGSDDRAQAVGAARARADAAAAKLKQVAEQAAGELRGLFPGWKVETKVVIDTPSWAIIKHAEGQDGGVFGGRADLVVVGSHGHGALKRLLLGSISHKVVTSVRCSTRIARGRRTESASRPLRLLVGTDGSANSLAAIDRVAAREWPAGTEIIVATADESTAAFDPVVGVIPIVIDEKWAIETARAGAARLTRPGLKVGVRTGVGLAHHVLLDIATTEQADCVFVGAQGMGAVERWLLGSVSASLAVHAPCTVEIVHPRVG